MDLPKSFYTTRGERVQIKQKHCPLVGIMLYRHDIHMLIKLQFY
ncbi:MAG: hypothetical protein ACTSWN_13105 [Promethearchaeota archaeon]